MSRTIDFLLFEDFQLLDAAGPVAAFEIASRIVGGAYRVTPVAVAHGLVRSSSGVKLHAMGCAVRRPHTLGVVGGQGVGAAARSADLIAFVQGVAGAGGRIASVCSGSFVLAAAGLLDGRRATTHWGRTASFAQAFPLVRLEPDRIYTRDGNYWTSAGISAGIDLALAMIADDLGERVARNTARQLVVPYRRSGGQSQFSSLLESQQAEGRFGNLLDWVRDHLRDPLTVEQLADRVCMSPRHFARAFKREMGLTPAKAVERLRLEAARVRLEADTARIEIIAEETGFGNPERMRHAFVRTFGRPPQALRQR
ncbi:MAG: GlxA family transcriptional regulator [Ectothiorhodospiraceae bacterium]|nr:GlxA family transcriptional regulator [Ectothiorhodospiraceae bacterium]